MARHLVAAVIAIGSLAAPAFASVDQIRIHVRGLACPFCVFGIEKNLKKLPGVTSVETTIRTGVIRMEVKSGTSLDTGRIEEAVAKSGFTLDRIEASVTGRLISRDGHPALEAQPGGQVFLLVEGKGEGIFHTLSAETLERLKRAGENGSRALTITGRVHSHAGMPPALAVESLELAP